MSHAAQSAVLTFLRPAMDKLGLQAMPIAGEGQCVGMACMQAMPIAGEGQCVGMACMVLSLVR